MIKIKNIFSSHKRKKKATSQERCGSHNLNPMIKVNINRGKPDIYAPRDMMRCKKNVLNIFVKMLGYNLIKS